MKAAYRNPQQYSATQNGQPDAAGRQYEEYTYAPPSSPPEQSAWQVAKLSPSLHNLLRQHFGYDEFLPLQEAIISTVL